MVVDSFDYIACYKGLHPNLDTAIEIGLYGKNR